MARSPTSTPDVIQIAGDIAEGGPQGTHDDVYE
jgi:hypothetical protein